MSREKLGFSGETQVANDRGGTKAHFTQAGLPWSFPIEDFAASLVDDNLRNMLSRIRPLRQKSEKALKTEQENNMPIELLIFRFYWVENKSALESGQIINWSITGIKRIMQRAGIPIRDISTSRILWQNSHPKELREMVDAAHEARRKKLAQQEQEALGLYPIFALFQLHYIEGYSVREISRKTGLTESRVRGFMRKYGVNDFDRPPLERGGKYQVDVNKSIGVYYKREAMLNSNQEYVIYRRYIASEYSLVTLEEVGGELGLTRERVGQIEKAAIKKLSSGNSNG